MIILVGNTLCIYRTHLFATCATHKSETTKPLPGEDTVEARFAFVSFEALTSLAVCASTWRKGATFDKLRDDSMVVKRVLLAMLCVKSSISIMPEKCPQSITIPLRNEMNTWTTMGKDAKTPQMERYTNFRKNKEFDGSFIFDDNGEKALLVICNCRRILSTAPSCMCSPRRLALDTPIFDTFSIFLSSRSFLLSALDAWLPSVVELVERPRSIIDSCENTKRAATNDAIDTIAMGLEITLSISLSAKMYRVSPRAMTSSLAIVPRAAQSTGHSLRPSYDNISTNVATILVIIGLTVVVETFANVRKTKARRRAISIVAKPCPFTALAKECFNSLRRGIPDTSRKNS